MDAYEKVREALRACDDQTVLVLQHLFSSDDLLPQLLQALGCKIDGSHNPATDRIVDGQDPSGAPVIQQSDSGPTDSPALASPSIMAPSPTVLRPEHRKAPLLLDSPVAAGRNSKTPAGGVATEAGGLRPLLSPKEVHCSMWLGNATDDPFQSSFHSPPKRMKHSFSLADISRCPAREGSPEYQLGSSWPLSLTNQVLQPGSPVEDQEAKADRVRDLLTAHLRVPPNHCCQDDSPQKQRSLDIAEQLLFGLQKSGTRATEDSAQLQPMPLDANMQQAQASPEKRSWGLPAKMEEARSMFDVLFPGHKS